MRIAVNVVGCDEMNGLMEVIKVLAKEKTDHQFIIFSDRHIPAMPGFGAVVIGSPVNNLMAKRWWLDAKLPGALRKSSIDILININGDGSLRTKIPQILYISNSLFIHRPEEFSSAELLFRKFYLPRYLAKSRIIIVPSQAVKQDLETHYNVSPDKMTVVHSIADISSTETEWEQREKLKETYTAGNEYFLFTGESNTLNDLVTVLKAFSRFKKWQRSEMKLVVTNFAADDATAERLKAYKFRQDVIVLDKLSQEQFHQLVSAAYGIIITPLYTAEGSAVIRAMSKGSPVIASSLPAITEVAGEAVLYAEPGNDEMIAANMIRLHKDELFRSQLVEAGKIQAEKYPGKTSAGILWKLIEDSVAG